MISEIEKVLKEAKAWLDNEETWENELDGLDATEVGKATIARIRKKLSEQNIH